MVELGNCRTTYQFKASSGIYRFDGQCIFDEEKLLEVQAKAETDKIDASSNTTIVVDVGNINYNNYSKRDDKASLTVYANLENFPGLNEAALLLIDELTSVH